MSNKQEKTQVQGSLASEIEHHEVKQRTTVVFQSPEAREAADRSSKDPIVSDELIDAVVASEAPTDEKKVVIKPRESVSRFRFGSVWYQLKKGHSMIVPKGLATVLEQKGIL